MCGLESCELEASGRSSAILRSPGEREWSLVTCGTVLWESGLLAVRRMREMEMGVYMIIVRSQMRKASISVRVFEVWCGSE